jgi:rRNA maturation endonuclease Nob1
MLGKTIVTIKEVIAELRDKNVRARMAGMLPYTLTFREPSAASMKAVSDFSKMTGDFRGLSITDLKVLVRGSVCGMMLLGLIKRCAIVTLTLTLTLTQKMCYCNSRLLLTVKLVYD